MQQNIETNLTSQIVTQKDTAKADSACVDVLATSVLLSMSVVNEAKQRLKKPLQQSNLTMNQWLVLKVLFLERANTPTTVANSMNADATTITRHLDNLEANGLVERAHKKSDRRVIEISITDEGKTIANQIYSSYEGILKSFKDNLVKDEHSMWKKVERCISENALALENAS